MTQTLTPSPRFDKLKRVLSELFQLDQAELDFGIYRIMNAKRGEITSFLDDDLLPQVQTELGKLAGGNRAEIEKELADTLKNATSLGVPDPEVLPKVKELRAKLSVTADLGALEADIYNDLAGFFKRYYQNGDFLSLRRYKKDVYAIPYEGEEVKLHWANADQYYVKSSESFRDYTFHLPDERRVHFKLADADTDANNNKAETGKERRFIVAEPPLLEENGELTVRFTYRASGEKQAKLNADAADTIMAQEGFDSWLSALKDSRPTEKNKTRTLFDKQLTDYTAKNSFDYFIHKDLRGFLRRELDFFIKNEVLHLDDLETEGESRALAQLARVRAMRGVAHKIIELLAQLENFQKKLWLKKKFVVSTDYCVTLDNIIENAPELLDEVAGNEAQRREWVQLFAIDELDGYSEPLTKAFLEANPFLVLDTQFFGAAFKDKLLSGFEDVDKQTDGLLVKSENFGALSLLQARYKEQVKCIYIDPPYNTGGDGFAYKDNYQHSSWLSMLSDRFLLTKDLMMESGLLFVSIDDRELHRLLMCVENCFVNSTLTTVTVKMSHLSGMKMAHVDRKLPKLKEYLVLVSRNAEIARLNPSYSPALWEEVFDRYTSFLEWNDDDPSNYNYWRRVQLKEAARDQGVVVDDTEAFEHFKLKNADRIFRTAVNDSSAVKDTPKDNKFRKIVTATGLEKFVYRQEEVIFAKSFMKEIEGKLQPAVPLGDLWMDIGINNLHNEGGTQFQNGKKPVKLVRRTMELVH